jgi:hypothetical protein
VCVSSGSPHIVCCVRTLSIQFCADAGIGEQPTTRRDIQLECISCRQKPGSFLWIFNKGGRLVFQRGVIEPLDLPPTLRIHCGPVPVSQYYCGELTSCFHSRVAVHGVFPHSLSFLLPSRDLGASPVRTQNGQRTGLSQLSYMAGSVAKLKVNTAITGKGRTIRQRARPRRDR